MVLIPLSEERMWRYFPYSSMFLNIFGVYSNIKNLNAVHIIQISEHLLPRAANDLNLVLA